MKKKRRKKNPNSRRRMARELRLAEMSKETFGEHRFHDSPSFWR